MAGLKYEWAFDIGAIEGGFACTGSDDGGAFSVTMTSGTYCHTDISSVVSGVVAFKTALAAALNTAATGAGTYSVTYDFTIGGNEVFYSIGYSAGNFSLDLTGSTAQTNLAKTIGFVGDQSGDDTYSSTVRPYYFLYPSMPGRSEMSDEYEPDGIVFESTSDDGTRYQMAVDTAETLSDWTQMGETSTAPALYTDPGTLVFERDAASAAPWTYQHAWRHARAGYHPFLCIDGGLSTSAVHLLRAEGGSFRPQRMASKDYALWNIPFKTALLGNL